MSAFSFASLSTLLQQSGAFFSFNSPLVPSFLMGQTSSQGGFFLPSPAPTSGSTATLLSAFPFPSYGNFSLFFPDHARDASLDSATTSSFFQKDAFHPSPPNLSDPVRPGSHLFILAGVVLLSRNCRLFFPRRFGCLFFFLFNEILFPLVWCE